MAGRREIGVIFGAGLAQGVALVTFPAISSILTSPQEYDLSNSAYGALFLPQAVAAIISALSGAGLTGRLGPKRVYLVGLAANLLAMTLLAVSQAFIGRGPLPYAVLLAATTSLGAGFGLTVPSLNRYAAAFFPDRADRAVLSLNALLGLGTALAPLFVAVFVGLGVWWGLPVIVALALTATIVASAGLPLRLDAVTTDPAGAGVVAREPGLRLPSRFWTFAAFALLYGVVETVNGNWATLYMTSDLGASATQASLALTAFWAMVTVGRVLFAAIERRFPESRTYRSLPFVVAVAFLLTASLPAGDASLGVLTFGLAGFGCSALLPLTISFGQAELTAVAAFVTGGLIAFYQMGYGLAAFGVGPLVDRMGLSLGTVFVGAAVVAVALGLLSLVVIRGRQPAIAPTR